MQLSYWEKSTFFKGIDFCIVGSGIVGLSTAIELKRKYPQKKVVILERSFLPYGASTRNAGFACFGSVTELADDLKKMPIEEVVSLAVRRYNGLKNLRNLLGDESIGLEINGGYELFDGEKEYEEALSFIPELNEALEEGIGDEVYKVSSSSIQKFGFKGFSGAIFNKYEGQIHTGKMMESLLRLAREEGVEILNGIGVEKVDNGSVQTNQDFAFSAKKIIITINGFAKHLLPEIDVEPARAQVILTTPIEGLKLKGTFHYDKGYYYFRDMEEGRVLFGGGRNLDFDEERTEDMRQTPLVMNALEKLLKEKILPDTKFEIEMRWSGVMGVGQIKEPIVKEVSPGIWVAVRMGGMGVALGSLIGKELAARVEL